MALRNQLALFEQQVLAGKRPKPQPTPTVHRLWSWLSRTWPDWHMALLVVTPAAVIRWHRPGFRWYWARLSQPRGHSVVSRATIALIKRVHLVSLGLTDVPVPNTIGKYVPTTRKPPGEQAQQSWRTFLANHRHAIWAMDCFTVATFRFQIRYVLVIISHDRRVIRHGAVTAYWSSS